MANRYFQLNQFIDQVKPTIIAEAGIDDFSVTEKYIEQALKNQQNVVYFGLGITDRIFNYKLKLSNLQEKYPGLTYFLIDLSENIDIQKLLNRYHLKESEVHFMSGNTIPKRIKL